jgi:hypothetical protein
MVDPIASKAVAKPLNSVAEQAGTENAKQGESKFDRVRSRLLDQQAANVQMPKEAGPASIEQQKVLKAELTNRLEKGGNQAATDMFTSRIRAAKSNITQLTKRVNALPKTPAFDPVRQRLASVDSQFQSAGQMVQGLRGTESPGDLMKIQMQMYQLTENLEIVSKVVEQVTSGVKSILQTQV